MVFVVGVISIGYILLQNDVVDENIAINGDDTDNSIFDADMDIFINIESTADYSIDFSDNEVISNEADFIIIGTIKSIDGAINYNPVKKGYTVIQTIGKIQVNKVLKGDIKENEISFIRTDGNITVSEYEKSLTEEYREYIGINKLNQDEKNSKYVVETTRGNITPEKEKTYLIYLTYFDDYERYGIRFSEYGLREIDSQSLNSDSNILNSDIKNLTLDEYKSIKVKNNETEEFEKLEDIVAENVVNNIKEQLNIIR